MKFTDTLTRWLQKFGAGAERDALYNVLGPVFDSLSSVSLTSAGLAIKTGGSALAKTGSAVWVGLADGKVRAIAASTDMPALTGISITADSFNVVVFFVDSVGTVTAVAGNEGADEDDVIWPDHPKGKAPIGALLITHSSTFTGGTTPLDTATTVYLNIVGALSPKCKVD